MKLANVFPILPEAYSLNSEHFLDGATQQNLYI